MGDVIESLIKNDIIEDSSKVDEETGTITTKKPSYLIEGMLDDYIVKKLQPGETAESTEKDNYTDGTESATIPKDFTVSSTDYTINTGLVVYGPDNSEFVWVPVSDINNMSQCSTAGGSCKLELQNGHLKCTTHNSEEIVGKLYATSTGENFGTVNTTYNADSGLREPAYLTNNSYGDNSSYNTIGLTLDGLKNDYKLMAESVAKYGGFYVGRIVRPRLMKQVP